MLVRCRSKTGTSRYEVQPSDDISVLLQKILEDAPQAAPDSVTLSNQPRGGESLVSTLQGSLADLGIKHGDLLFVAYQDHTEDTTSVPSSAGIPNGHPTTKSNINASVEAIQGAKKPWESVVEDPVDRYWEAQDGKIKRSRDSKMCRHGDKSMCDHCMPLEPYDPKYQKEQNIKHLSFHAYLRKLDIAANKTTSSSSNTFIPPLEEPDFKVQVPCSSGTHPSWPAGICTKCQPSAVTLSLQQYRMVDHVEFATPLLIENLLNFWRSTRMQRFGWLLGRFEAYDKVPMGIKAVVEAIHEPPQAGDEDGIQLGVPWEDEDKVESLANMCGLQVVGMIFTDLVPDEEKRSEGKVLCKRHKDSFFLSSLEAIFAAREAKKRPNLSRFSATGKFSSKFVTCVVTGNLEGDVAVEAYQVSDQAMAMVEADMIEASVDPGVVRIKEDTSGDADSSKKRYIPDVFYTYHNQYNLQVKESAKPCFPTDYLCVSLTNGFPTDPAPRFAGSEIEAFPTENRPGLQDQSFEAVAARFSKIAQGLPRSLGSSETGLDVLRTMADVKGKGRAGDVSNDTIDAVSKCISDWHLLAYLDTTGVFDKADMALLAKAASFRRHDDIDKLLSSNAWQTLLTLVAEHAPKGSGSSNEAVSSVPDFPADAEGFPIIPDDHDMMRTDSPALPQQDTSGDFTIPGEGGADTVICPHCTFENPATNQDCEICSLPLRG